MSMGFSKNGNLTQVLQGISFQYILGRKVKLSPSSVKLVAFDNRQSLNIIGKFNAILLARAKLVHSMIFVTKEQYQYPTSCEDSLYKLGLILFTKRVEKGSSK